MEALVLSCSTGGGHNSAAQALVQALQDKGHQVTFFDPYSLKSNHLAHAIGNTYIKLVQTSPSLFGMIYRIGDQYAKIQNHISIPSPVYLAQKKSADLLEAYLKKHDFDVILTSHVFCGEILTQLKNRKVNLPPIYFITTDYTCAPFDSEVKADYINIASSDLKEEFMDYNIPEEKLLTFGIPVRKEFSETLSKPEAKAALSLDQEKHYILVSGGSIGVGDIYDTIEILKKFILSHKEYEILVFVGNNHHLYEHLKLKYEDFEQLHLILPTNQVPLYMKASDVFISKPGGLSSTEACAAQIPFLIITPIPGCEECNAQFFAKHGAAIYVHDVKNELNKALLDVLKKEQSALMMENQKRTINAQAAEDLIEWIEKKDRN